MFTHLHVHTEYSLLDGMCRIPQLVARARELGMDSLAITDHGSMYGVVDFYLAAKEAGIKPIIGCELYVAPASRLGRSATDKNPFHLTLLAKDQVGYHNLLQLTTRGHLEGFYYRPRVDRELLARYHEGLIALSGCLQGEIARLLLEGRQAEARAAALWHKETFGDYYLEIQRHPIPDLERANRELFALSQELGIPLVATNDVHYIERGDAPSHDLLLCVQTNASIHDEKRMKMAGDFFYLKSPQEMAEAMADHPEALENSQRIAGMCHLDLEFGAVHLPEVELPPGRSADEHLAELCWQGLRERYPPSRPAGTEVEQRLAYELEVIQRTQFAAYFLVVRDIISFVRQQNILFGVRGSAAASLALYCLGITDTDPLAHKLVFERFLNVERKEMPDIDLDFQDDRRNEVISYVVQHYGPEHVAQIITFGTLGARAALRDVGRALGISYPQVDRVAKLVPFGVGMTLEKALEESGELRDLYQGDSTVKQLVDSAQRLEGIARHASTHAAGIVISREPLIRYVPLLQAGRGEDQGMVMTQFSMENIAKVGLLKMDLLGLINLTTLARAKEILQRERGVEIDLHHLPLEDPSTFKLLSSGETTGVFQLESGGMRRCLRELKPTTFSDLAAIIALYRPGPKEHIPAFIESKHGLKPVQYPHPALAEILKETYGIIVYQDQVLKIVQTFAGYSLGQADIVRKAMGKKIPEIMRRERQRFIEGATGKGFAVETAEEVFNLIEPFAGYAFNKAHSVSYATIAYQTAYLKANYPVEYMTAFLITNADQQEKIATAASECHRLGISVLPPDISKSAATFSIERTEGGAAAIRFGLANIKNVGEGAVAPILVARGDRAGGAFKSLEDLCRRTDLRGINKKVLESLIKAGALDSVGNRGALLQGIENILSLSHQEQRRRETGQSTMFDLWGESVASPLPTLELAAVEIPLQERLGWEKELLGAYLSEHPFSRANLKLDSKAATAMCGQIDTEMGGQTVTVAGVLTSLRQSYTRDRQLFISAILEDLVGSVALTCWPRVYQQTRSLWVEGNALMVQGKVKAKDDEVQVVCEQVWRYQHREEERGEEKVSPTPPAPSREGRRLTITIVQTHDEPGDVERLQRVMEIVREHPGPDEVCLAIATDDGVVNLEMSNLTAHCCPELQRKLLALLPEESLREEAR